MIKSIVLSILLCALGANVIGQNIGNNTQRGQLRSSAIPAGTQTSQPEKPDVNLLSQEKADMYQEILQVDDFQKEVLKTFLKEHYQKVTVLSFDETLKLEDKLKGVSASRKALEKSLLGVFSAEQTKIIMTEEDSGTKERELKKEKKKEKKKKKKKKKKDNG